MYYIDVSRKLPHSAPTYVVPVSLPRLQNSGLKFKSVIPRRSFVVFLDFHKRELSWVKVPWTEDMSTSDSWWSLQYEGCASWYHFGRRSDGRGIAVGLEIELASVLRGYLAPAAHLGQLLDLGTWALLWIWQSTWLRTKSPGTTVWQFSDSRFLEACSHHWMVQDRSRALINLSHW